MKGVKESGSKVDAELLEQNESGNDEAATDGDDTSNGIAELDISRRLLTGRRRRVCKRTSAAAQGKIGDGKVPLSYRELYSASLSKRTSCRDQLQIRQLEIDVLNDPFRETGRVAQAFQRLAEQH